MGRKTSRSPDGTSLGDIERQFSFYNQSMSRIACFVAPAVLFAAFAGCAAPGAVQQASGPSYLSLKQDRVMVLAAADGPVFDAAQSLALGEVFRRAIAEQCPGISFQGPAALADYTSDTEVQQTAAHVLRQSPTDTDLFVLRRASMRAGYLMTARIVEERVRNRSREATEEASIPRFSYYDEKAKVHTMGELDYVYSRYLQSERLGTVEVALYALKDKKLAWSARLDVNRLNEIRQELSRTPPPVQGPRSFTGAALFSAAAQTIAAALNSAVPQTTPDPQEYPPAPPVSELIRQAAIDAGRKLQRVH